MLDDSGSNQKHYVHGTGDTPQEPDWPELDASELAKVLGQYYDVGALQEITWRSPRPFSSAARIRTAKGLFFVKRHGTLLRSKNDILAEHHFMQFLSAHGLPVVTLIPTKQGETAFTDQGWTYELHCVGQGHDLYRDRMSWTPYVSDEHAYRAGEMLARLHDVARHYVAPPRSTRFLLTNMRVFGQRDPVAALQKDCDERLGLERFFEKRDWQKEISEQLIEPFHQAAYAALQASPAVRGHGDWHGSNMLWTVEGTGADVATVLDFGLSDQSTVVLDVATALERSMVSWINVENGKKPLVQYDQVTAFLQGYACIAGWGAGAFGAVADVFPIAHADFALSEIDYFDGLIHNSGNADLAYEGYLLGHAQWFCGAEGQRLLGHIRQCKPKD